MIDVTRDVTAEYAKARKAADEFDTGWQPDITHLMRTAYMHGYAQALIEEKARRELAKINTPK